MNSNSPTNLALASSGVSPLNNNAINSINTPITYSGNSPLSMSSNLLLNSSTGVLSANQNHIKLPSREEESKDEKKNKSVGKKMFLKTFGKGTSNKDKTSGIVISSPVNFKDSKSEKSQIYPMVTLDKSFSKKRYILPERERCKNWENSELNIEIVCEYEMLSGFRLYIVEEWVFSSQLYWSIIEETGNPDDKIYVSIAQSKQNGGNSIPFLETVFLKQNNLVFPRETNHGIILIADMNLAHSNLTLLPVFGGDYDQTIYLYIHLITLKRLGCGDKLTNVEYQGLLEDKFYSMYQFPQSVPIATAMEQVVEEIQSALHILNILPSQIPIDGVFNNVTLDAVHIQYNSMLDSTRKLPETGIVTEETYQALNEYVSTLSKKLENLGFGNIDHPLKNNSLLASMIQSFQMSHGLPPDGVFNKRTLQELDRIWKERMTNLSYLPKKSEDEGTISPNESMDYLKTNSNIGDPIEHELKKRLSAIKLSMDPNLKGTENNTFTDFSSLMKSTISLENKNSNFDLLSHKFISCEQEKWKEFAKIMNLEILAENEVLSGYRIHVVEDWFFDASKEKKYFVTEADPELTISVTVLKLTKPLLPQHQKIFREYFLQGYENSEVKFYIKDTALGTLLLAKLDNFDSQNFGGKKRSMSMNFYASLINDCIIPDGLYDKHIQSIHLQFSLRRLGCGFFSVVLDNEQYLEQMESRLRGLYGILNYIPLEEAVDTLIKEVKAALIHLKYLSKESKIDNFYDNYTLEAMKKFQAENNIKITGYLSGATYQMLFTKIMELKSILEKGGIHVPTEDPFKNYDILHKALEKSTEEVDTETSNFRNSNFTFMKGSDKPPIRPPLKFSNDGPSPENSYSGNLTPIYQSSSPPMTSGQALLARKSISQDAVRRTRNRRPSSQITATSPPPIVLSANVSNPYSSNFQPRKIMNPEPIYPEVHSSSGLSQTPNNFDDPLLNIERQEREELRKQINELESIVERQIYDHNILQTNYTNLENNYSSLKKEAKDLLDRFEHLRTDLKDTKSQFNKLQFNYKQAEESLKEHENTIQGYREKINILQETVQRLQRQYRSSVINSLLKLLLLQFFQLIAVIIFSITKGIDFVRNRTVGGSSSYAKTIENFIQQKQKSLSQMNDASDQDLAFLSEEEEDKGKDKAD